MRRLITIEQTPFVLYQLPGVEYLSDKIINQRGVLYGSDCLTAYAFMVDRRNVPECIRLIQSFLEVLHKNLCEAPLEDETQAFEVGSLDEEFVARECFFLHFQAEAGPYDLFITPFDEWCFRRDEEASSQAYQTLVATLRGVSAMSVCGGALSNDDGIEQFCMNFLFLQPEVAKIILETDPTFYQQEYHRINGDTDFQETHLLTLNEPDAFKAFVPLYMNHIPYEYDSEYFASVVRAVQAL